MNTRTTLFVALLFALPLLVALFDLSLPATLVVVLILVAWRWLATLRALSRGGDEPPYVLETIGASHFAEKVRWPMDWLGISYGERICAGTLGAFYWGRTVPVLEFRSGRVWSQIGNSAEILRYLWGAYGERPDAAFLRPTAERVELEARLDRYGQNIQVWLYSHLLEQKAIMLKAWGAEDPAVPAWQRLAIRVLYPVQVVLMRRAFRLTPEHSAKALGHIEALLADFDAALEKTPSSILGEDEPNYADLAFAALSTPWVLPVNFANRDKPVLDLDELPEAMRDEIDRFRETYPAARDFVLRLYRDKRSAGGAEGE